MKFSRVRTLTRVTLYNMAFIALTACNEEKNPSPRPEDLVDDAAIGNYQFPSRFDESVSSVSYGGQVARHALIGSIGHYIHGLESMVATNSQTAEEVQSTLYYLFTCSIDTDENGVIDAEEQALCDGDRHRIETTPPPRQETIGELSGGKSIVEKIAGNDPVGQTVDWATQGITGWPIGENKTAEGLIGDWIDFIANNAIQIADGQMQVDPIGNPITRPELSAHGRDYGALIQHFLLGALAFSQGADDYLDYDIIDAAGTDLVATQKGLYADHSELVSGKNYTALEHTWDEGFGYFGAAINYQDFADSSSEIESAAPRIYSDIDGDSRIDLLEEYNWGHAAYALGSDLSRTYAKIAYEAFYKGRLLISSIEGTLTERQMAKLKTYSDQAILAWEKVIAVETIIRLKATLDQLDREPYVFEQHAKAWSEMKGLALSFQFNRRSLISSEHFSIIHAAIGVAPTLPGSEELSTHKQALLASRDLLTEVFDLNLENL